MRKVLKFLMSRVVIVGLLILFQFALIASTIFLFVDYFVLYYAVTSVIGIVFVCRIVNRKDNPSYKIAWIILVMALPPFGVAVYIIFRGNKLSDKTRLKMAGINKAMKDSFGDNSRFEPPEFDDYAAKKQSEYITNRALTPPFSETDVVYFPSGEEMYTVMTEKLRSAKKYIFMEYFIIARGEMWDGIFEILKEKAEEGVDVRLMYDDMGCITHLDTGFKNRLEIQGIKCRVFNRFVPVLSARLNNRNHRKICVVDGQVAFTGGVNLADEYINTISRYGYWKDNAVMLSGKGAWSFTVMFLSMWDYLDPSSDAAAEYEAYMPESFPKKENGIVQPYTDNPLDDVPVGETIYLNLLYNARRYVWITTPYLIIDYQMEQALCSAAGSGIDVRIITPGIPDKYFVNESTKSHYEKLIRSGVKIYEYTPGFIHAKTFVCDDVYATVGTVNLDFRSLYLHFECGVWMYKSAAVADIKRDYEEMIKVSREITLEDCRANIFKRFMRSVIELVAPLI